MGIIVGMVPRSFLQGEEQTVALLTLRSSKTPRQVLGSNGAEVQAVTEAEDTVFRTFFNVNHFISWLSNTLLER